MLLLHNADINRGRHVIRFSINLYILDKYSLLLFGYEKDSASQSVNISKVAYTAVHFVKLQSRSERTILSQQPTCTEVAVRHKPVIPGRVSLHVNTMASLHIEHATPSLSWSDRRTPDFIPPTPWPPNSPDLRPADYSTCLECSAGESLRLQNS